MKPNPSLLSLLIALLIHSVILVLVWYGISHEENEDKPFYKEKRFGITVNEETDIVQSITPPSASPQSSAISKAKKADAPIPLAQEQHPTPAIELKRITEADRESLPYSVLHHYGNQFFELSAGEQHYIIDNLQKSERSMKWSALGYYVSDPMSIRWTIMSLSSSSTLMEVLAI